MNNTKWINEEFSNLDLGDERLTKRFKQVASSFYAFPLSSINKACKSWNQVKSAYNLLKNKKCETKKIFFEHQSKTFERIKQQKKGEVILVPQDTTHFNFSHHPKATGMGKLTRVKDHKQFGFLMHSSIALTKDGLPLGIVDQNIYTRKDNNNMDSELHKSLPITKKESFRWIQHLETLVNLKDDYDVISICDREGDIFEYIQSAVDFGVSFIVRSGSNRFVTENNCHSPLINHLKKLKPKGKIVIKVENTKNRKKRLANFKVYFDSITIKTPKRRKSARTYPLEEQKINVVYAKEINPPHGEKRKEWILLTNRNVKSFTDALFIVDCYKKRWNIENWHKIIKSGFNLEDCRLKTYERLERYACLISILAWKIYFLLKLKRIDPKLSCENIFEDYEWKALFFKINRSFNFPKKPPSVGIVIDWIGRLGGHLNRKNDGDPGMTVLWRGMQRFSDIVDDYQIFQKEFMGNS